MEELVRLYGAVHPSAMRSARWWMSRATLLMISPDAAVVLLAPLSAIRIFGMTVMIDDRMADGAISVEQCFGSATITKDVRN